MSLNCVLNHEFCIAIVNILYGKENIKTLMQRDMWIKHIVLYTCTGCLDPGRKHPYIKSNYCSTSVEPVLHPLAISQKLCQCQSRGSWRPFWALNYNFLFFSWVDQDKLLIFYCWYKQQYLQFHFEKHAEIFLYAGWSPYGHSWITS